MSAKRYPLLRFSVGVRREPAIEIWLDGKPRELGTLARRWFDRLRACGPDVRELLHDGFPTACVEDAPFGSVNAFKAHLNVGFFHGASLPDPKGLLEGEGKYMRHVSGPPRRAGSRTWTPARKLSCRGSRPSKRRWSSRCFRYFGGLRGIWAKG